MQKIDYTKYEKPSDYMKFPVGKTTIQIVSNGLICKRHGNRMGGRYIPLGICTEKPDCKFCLQGIEPKMKWEWIVYIPEKNQVKLLDAGIMLGDSICQLAKVEGDPQEYQLLVTKTGQNRDTKYSVTKGTKVELSADIKAFIEPAKQFLIKKYFGDK